MARLLVLYNQPTDAAAFDRYYYETHVPIAKKVPGLRSFVVSSGNPAGLVGGPAPHLVAALDFDNMPALQAAMASPEGQAAAADIANFAHTGITLMAFDTRAL